MRILATFLVCLLVSAIMPWSTRPAAAEGPRVALVIGNSAYAHVPQLGNPSRDATGMAAMLKAASFGDVTLLTDLDAAGMRRALRDFSIKSAGAEIALVYYAGHGIEVNGINYLIPVDAKLERDFDVEDEAVSLERVSQSLESVSRLRLIMLDACRDNPFVKVMKRTAANRSIGRGLAPIDVNSTDTLVAYAAKAGSTASDGEGTNSPFAAALVRHLPTPGLDVRIALGRVRDDVRKTTNNQQEPFLYGSLGGAEISLVPAQPQPQPESPAASEAAQAWQSVQTSEQVPVLEAFVKQFPQTVYAAMAEARIKDLQAKLAMKQDDSDTPPVPAISGTVPPPGPSLASTAWTATAKDIAGWKLKKSLRLGGALASAKPSLDRSLVAIGAHREGSIHVVDASLKAVAKIAVKPYKSYSMRDVLIAPGNTRVAGTFDGETRLFDIASGALITKLPVKRDFDIATLYQARDGLLFDTRSSVAPQRSIVYFRKITDSGFETFGELPFGSRIDSFDATPDGKFYVASTYPDHQLMLYDVEKRSIVWQITCQCTARFMAGGQYVVFTGRPGDDAGDYAKNSSIGLISVADTAKSVAFDSGTAESATLEDVSPDGQFAAIGYTNIGRVTIVAATLDNFRPLVQLNDRSGQNITGAAFVGENALITASGDNNARLWSK